MSNLQLFAFNDLSVRVVPINNEPWFIAQDICNILDLSNVSKACKPLKDREKQVLNLQEMGITSSNDPDTTRLLAVSESGLYRISMKCRKPQAEPFQDWICEEVLPAIRKTGKYEVEFLQPVIPSIPQTLSEALRFAADLNDQKQKLLEANQALKAEVEIMEPKADRYDLAMSTEGWMSGEEIVKQLNVPNLSSTRKLYDILRKEKVLFKRPDGSNCPFADWSKNGLAALRNGRCFDGRMRFSPVFSYKGLDRILDILRKHGITPRDKQFQFNFDSNKPTEMKRA
jgi:anti-repressor protein